MSHFTAVSSLPGLPPAQSLSWLRRAAYPLVTALLGLTELALFSAVHHRHYGWSVLLILVLAHLMHGSIIGLHEASHGHLRKNRFLNELDGIVIGILSLTSFSLFRVVHQTHHSHLASERDLELWPFVLPGKPRWFRILAAFAELFAGLFYTPLLMLRTYLRADSPIRSSKVRRRIAWELALVAVVWAGILASVAHRHLWQYLLWMYLAPAWLAANLHGWRKYVEHVGLTGNTIRGITRSIVADDLWGRMIAFSLLHEPFHGVHHQRIGLPHSQLPDFASELEPAAPDEPPPFRSYGHAFRHLLRSLADPRVGPQWLSSSAPGLPVTVART